MAKPASRVLRTGGLYFDGVDDYVEVSNTVLPPGTTSFTVLVWAYFNTIPYDAQVILKQGLGYVYGTFYIFTQYNNIFRCALRGLDGAWTAPSVGGSIYPNTWYFLGLRYDGSEVSLWVNAEKKASASFSSPVGVDQPLRLAHPYGVSNIFLNGLIDEVRIYNGALTDAEINEIYNKGTFIKDGLVLYLDFSEYEGNIAYDKSGYGNHGIIYGGAMWVVKKALRVLPKAG